ncbi:unnamed protein product [Darwinula stevensoni]|uniref:Uncharacterized protein n=1 Tax=Darwinula stevensoni TaxID=69355 RepID=A0A7R9A9Q9_9CRUS|nr:unnamed protein product [Darwinula stevensoni]CAG0897680.1 unnamed protein product [Darwinula stevensoni]
MVCLSSSTNIPAMKILWALSAFVLSQAAVESNAQTDWMTFFDTWKSLNCSYPPQKYLEVALKDMCSNSSMSQASVEGIVCSLTNSSVLEICNASKGNPKIASLFPLKTNMDVDRDPCADISGLGNVTQEQCDKLYSSHKDVVVLLSYSVNILSQLKDGPPFPASSSMNSDEAAMLQGQGKGISKDIGSESHEAQAEANKADGNQFMENSTLPRPSVNNTYSNEGDSHLKRAKENATKLSDAPKISSRPLGSLPSNSQEQLQAQVQDAVKVSSTTEDVKKSHLQLSPSDTGKGTTKNNPQLPQTTDITTDEETDDSKQKNDYVLHDEEDESMASGEQSSVAKESINLDNTDDRWEKKHIIDTPEGDSHFFSYFITVVLICVIGYVLLHNKNKIIALVVEGRGGRHGRRRPSSNSYQKLDTNLEDALRSSPSRETTSHVIY